MGMYSIEVSYQTGDSFGSQDTSDVLELTWDNLEVAKRNLKAIKEHDELYSKLNGYDFGKNRDQLLEEASKKPWFVQDDKSHFHGSLRLEADNGNYMQLHAMWCGYFESLHGAKIIVDNSDMEFRK